MAKEAPPWAAKPVDDGKITIIPTGTTLESLKKPVESTTTGAPNWASEPAPEWAVSGAPDWAAAAPDHPSSTTGSRILGTLGSLSDLILGIPGLIAKSAAEQEATAENTIGNLLNTPGYQTDTSAAQEQFLKDMREARGGVNLRTGMSTDKAIRDYYNASQNAIASEARQTAERRIPMWMQAPAMTAMEKAGYGQAYAESAPARAMGWFGEKLESGAAYLESAGGLPRATMLNYADAAMAYTGAKIPSAIKARMVAPKEAEVIARLRAEQPTGVAPPRVVSEAEVRAVQEMLDKEKSAPSKPIDSPEVKAAKQRRTRLAEGEYISSTIESDFTDWDAAHQAQIERVRQIKEEGAQMPERAAPGEIPPIEAYEGAIPPPETAAAEIKGVLADPDMTSPVRVISETAKDVAAEKVADAVRPNIVYKPVSAGIYMERSGIKEVSPEVAAQLKEAGFGIDTTAPDGGVSQLRSMLQDEQRGYMHFKPAQMDVPQAAEWINHYRQADFNMSQAAQWIRNTAVQADIAANRVIGGLPGETISARAGRMKSESASWNTVAKALDYAVPGHTARAMEATALRQAGMPPPKEGGFVTPRYIVPLGVTATGAIVGTILDPENPIAGALEGAVGAFAIANLGRAAVDYGVGTKMGQVWSAIRPSIDPVRAQSAAIVFARTANIKAGLREVGALQRAMKKAISPARMEEITHIVQRGALDELTPVERYYVGKVQQWYDRIGTHAQETGVIPRLITKNYVPHAWDLKDAATKKFFDEGGFDRLGTGVFTAHGLKRGVGSYMEGLALGLKPKSLNYAELLGMYANSVVRAVHNAEAVYTLKTTDLGGGVHPVEPVGLQPKSYIVNHGIEGLEGHAVHPEAIKPLQRAFATYDPGVIERALLGTAFTFKRVAVSYSGFHPVALTLAYTGAGGNPLAFAAGALARGVERLSGDRIRIPYRSAVDRALDAYYSMTPEAATVANWGIRNGLELGTPIEDIVGKKVFDRMTEVVDKAIGSDIHGLKPFERMDAEVHKFIWNYTQTGMKLAIFQKELSRAVMDPKNFGKDLNAIAQDVASYTNNLFGTLDWARVVERQRSQVGRAVAGSAYSKKGLTAAQIVVFAPDWLVSTMRSWSQAIPGLSENARVASLHRGYLMRSMLYTLAFSDMLNYSFSGHHIWQNDFRSDRRKRQEGEQSLADQLHDMTYIDMGNGQRMQSNKHLFEFIHAITDPGKFAANKASAVITDPINMLANRQWATFDYAPPISTSEDPLQKAADYAKWMVEHHAPISLQQALKGNMMGTFGFPVTGLSAEDRAKLRQEERQKGHR